MARSSTDVCITRARGCVPYCRKIVDLAGDRVIAYSTAHDSVLRSSPHQHAVRLPMYLQNACKIPLLKRGGDKQIFKRRLCVSGYYDVTRTHSNKPSFTTTKKTLNGTTKTHTPAQQCLTHLFLEKKHIKLLASTYVVRVS